MQDQAILSGIVGSLTPGVAGLVMFATTAAEDPRLSYAG